jgi:hypothetical protein
MSPIVFWAAIIAAFFISIGLSTAEPHNVAQIAGAALAWIATFSLGWMRWAGRSGLWLGRMAAAAGALILVALVHDWLFLTDVFVIYRRGCPPRMGSFWPLFFVWIAGIGLQTFALWGKRFGIEKTRYRPTLRATAWWLLTLPWTVACGYVFVRNINPVAVGVSLTGAAKLLGVLLATAGVVAVPLWLSTRSERRTRKRALADYEAINPETRSALLDLIDRHARTGEHRLIYRVGGEKSVADAFARVGGQPLAKLHELWPLGDDGRPGTFLLQLPVVGVSGEVWRDRFVSVYLLQHELLVTSHAGTGDLILQTAPVHGEPLRAQTLVPLAVPILKPAGDDEELDGETLSGEWLLENIPDLGDMLSNLTSQPERILSMLLVGSEGAGSWAIEDAIIVGGEPELIQGPHEPKCETCRQPMRFLLQFGDVTDGNELGDCGIGYVYGCDAHPEHCQAFVDCY